MYLRKTVSIFTIFFVLLLSSGAGLAKGGLAQDQIILLNDSASALEDSNPELSKDLTALAQVKQKEWEDANAGKPQLPIPLTDKYKLILKERVRLLNAAASAITPTYPLIAKSLGKMANEINRTINHEN